MRFHCLRFQPSRARKSQPRSTVARRLGVAESLARCVPDRRDPTRIAHTAHDEFEERVFAREVEIAPHLIASTPIASVSHKQRAVNRAMELRLDRDRADLQLRRAMSIIFRSRQRN
jgi:hypothetical protein